MDRKDAIGNRKLLKKKVKTKSFTHIFQILHIPAALLTFNKIANNL